MKNKIFTLVVIFCALYLLDRTASFIFLANFAEPISWNENVKSARQLTNALLLSTAYLAYFRVSRNNPSVANFPNTHFKQIVQHGMIGFSVAFAIIFLCLVLTPEFYGPQSGFRVLSFEQVMMPLTVWLGGAIIEEVIYRGILQRCLEMFLPIYIAAIIQVILFVFSHSSSILGHSSPVSHVCSLFLFGLLTTCMAKKSPYLVLPIFFHFGENFFTELVRGQYSHGWDIPGIWVYQDQIRLAYRPFFYFAICIGCWYTWHSKRKCTDSRGQIVI